MDAQIVPKHFTIKRNEKKVFFQKDGKISWKKLAAKEFQYYT